MAKTTLFFAAVLIVLGLAVFVATGSHAPTALIPAFFGVVLGVFGLLANTEDSKRRMLFMHIAVSIGLVGFLFPGIRAMGDVIKLLQNQTVLRPIAMWEELAMSILCLIFVLLSVRSFIVARRARRQA
ncbi:MAG TPA: hypothetical protein VMU62_03055 [Acidobacteriaceae bacterium]|nr:hypothetical protein [Acidobacteriaceae bacterium]